MSFTGLITALITPFTRNGEVDLEGLQQLIARQVQAGVQGVLVMGTTGESPSLTATERDLIISASVGSLPVMVGCGTQNTDQTIAHVCRAAELGASSALVVVPYYLKPSDDGLFHHFQAVAKASPIPLVLYDVPSRTGKGMTPETIRRLSHLPQIHALKDATGHLSHLMDVVSLTKAPFEILCGNDDQTLASIACGARGCISVASNLVPQAMKELVRLALEGHIEAARQYHYRLLPLMRALFLETNPVPVKTALAHWGLPAGGVRLPLWEMTPIHRKTLIDLLPHYRETTPHGPTQSPLWTLDQYLPFPANREKEGSLSQSPS